MIAVPKKKVLSVFGLVMINVIAIDSLRTLPIGAEYGFSLITFYLIATLLFFLPVALVSAELATAWPNTGGSYIWIREAFGKRWGFLSIWLMWIYNIAWYPTIFSFIAATVAYLIDPSLAQHRIYMLVLVLSSFWLVTLLNCLGIKAAALLSTIGALIGTLLPMAFISGLGAYWLFKGNPLQITFSWQALLPHLNSLNDLAFSVVILFGLMGLEMSCIHAGDVKDPMKDYPKAVTYSAFVIVATLVLASLAIACVVPKAHLNVMTGFIDAFKIFLSAYHLEQYTSLIVLCVVIGSLAGAGAWMLGPSRALSIALKETDLPGWMSVEGDDHHAPKAVLLLQGILTTLLCVAFLLMPTVSSAYWILSALSAQLALFFYVLLFAAAIRLRYKHANIHRAYRIPGGQLGIWLVGGVGIVGSLLAIIIGFLPPTTLITSSVWSYEATLIIGMISLLSPVLLIRMKD